MGKSPDSDNDKANAALDALDAVLFPLAKVLLDVGLTSKELEGRVRQVYVTAAARQLAKNGGKVVLSNVALRCGLDRAEVRRILESESASNDEARLEAHRLNRVINGWRQDPDFCEPNGNARALDYSGETGFGALVNRYAPSLYAASVCAELVRVGVVLREQDGRVSLRADKYSSQGMDRQSLSELRGRSQDVMVTLAQRAIAGGDQPLVAEAIALNVDAASIHRLRRTMRDRAESFVRLIDEELCAPAVQASPGAGKRVGIIVIEVGEVLDD